MSCERVGLFVAGVRKGGSHAIKNYLKQHSQICINIPDEGHAFDNEHFFSVLGMVHFPPIAQLVYSTYFEVKPEHKIVCDVTPGYLYNKLFASRLYAYNSKAKIIALLRNPIERIYSGWVMRCKLGIENCSFAESIRRVGQLARDTFENMYSFHGFLTNQGLDQGFYSEQIRNLWRFFPKEQIKFYKSEELRGDHQRVLNEIAEWVGLDPFPEIKHEEVFCGKYPGLMKEEDKDYLKEIYYYEIKQLERMLGWDCTEWLEC